MYLNFYNMAKAPFHITPDPEFLYLSPSHKEALGAIIYCIEKKKGFVSVFGEVGTGKTTLIRSYLARRDKNRIKTIYVFNPSVTFAELLKTIFQELGVKPHNEIVYDMVQQLHTILIKKYVQGLNIVLIVDEAQNMPSHTFEQLCILSNLETPKEKLIQIILVGQPELAEKLAGKELRQLNQRLAIRATLLPLSPKESRDYILFRLDKVTPSPDKIFTTGALKTITKTAKGSPRMLNILCDNALIAGFGYKEKRVTRSIVKQVIADFEGKGRTKFSFSWMYASMFGIFLLSVASLNGMNSFRTFAQLSSGRNSQPSTTSKLALIETKARITGSTTSIQMPTNQGMLHNNGVKSGLDDSKVPSEIALTKQVPRLPVSQDNDRQSKKVSLEMPSAPVDSRGNIASPSSFPKEVIVKSKTRKVKRGEHLSQIIFDMYGFVNDQIIQAVKERNPSIFDADLIFVGDTIFFPELLKPKKRRTDLQGG